MAVEHPCHVQYQTFAINLIFNTTSLCPWSGGPIRSGVWQPPTWRVVAWTFATVMVFDAFHTQHRTLYRSYKTTVLKEYPRPLNSNSPSV